MLYGATSEMRLLPKIFHKRRSEKEVYLYMGFMFILYRVYTVPQSTLDKKTKTGTIMGYIWGIPCQITQPLHQHSPNLTKVGQ